MQLSFMNCILLLLSAFILVSGGCASESGSFEDWTLSGDTDEEPESPETEDEMEDEAEPPDAGGIWLMKFAIAYFCDLPVFNQTVQFLLVGIAKLEAEQDGTELHFTENICDFDMTIVESIDFHITFPKAAIESIPVKPRLGTFSSTEIGGVFHAGPVIDIYGADENLNGDPAGDPLPLESDDPLVLDFDNDGKPGLTARITGVVSGEVYVLMRLMRDLDGIVMQSDRIEGNIESNAEMITLDADPWVLALQLDLDHQPQPELNRFEMIHISDNLSCDEILSRQDDLFDYNPLDYAIPLDEQEN